MFLVGVLVHQSRLAVIVLGWVPDRLISTSSQYSFLLDLMLLVLTVISLVQFSLYNVPQLIINIVPLNSRMSHILASRKLGMVTILLFWSSSTFSIQYLFDPCHNEKMIPLSIENISFWVSGINI